MSWKEVEFQTLFSDNSRNGIYKGKEFQGSGIPMVSMGEMFRFDRIGNQVAAAVQMTNMEMRKSGLRHGDLLFGRRSLVEAGAGKCSMVFHPVIPLTFESSIIRVRLNTSEADPEFYFNYFPLPSWSVSGAGNCRWGRSQGNPG